MVSIATRRRGERARGRVEKRASTELLLARATLLPEVDRLLLEQATRGMKLASLAKLHRVTPYRLERRLRQIRAVLRDPCFLLAGAFATHIPAEMRCVARSYYIARMSLRECAARHRLTIHQVRQALEVARGIMRIAGGEMSIGSSGH